MADILRRCLRAIFAPLAVAMLVAATPAAAEIFDETPRIAVISAFEPERIVLHEMMTERAEHTENGVTFTTGKLAGEDVVLFLSGIGMVNAAMTTQLALNHFDITSIVFSGIAGGVDPALQIGDVVVAEQWGPYLFMVIARETGAGYEVPSLFGKPFANYGTMFPQEMRVRREGSDTVEKLFWFKVDAALLEIARDAAQDAELVRCTGAQACLSEAPQVVVGGNGVSGSAFVDNADFRDYVFDTFEAKVLDMETSAVAQVAYANAVPFIAFRSLSDLAGGGEGANEMDTFFQIAAQNAAEMVRAFVAKMAERDQ